MYDSVMTAKGKKTKRQRTRSRPARAGDLGVGGRLGNLLSAVWYPPFAKCAKSRAPTNRGDFSKFKGRATPPQIDHGAPSRFEIDLGRATRRAPPPLINRKERQRYRSDQYRNNHPVQERKP